jgi:hypothetical protein
MSERNWGTHHLEWHTVRQWDRLPPPDQQWAQQQGWRRADVQEGEAGNGFEFLVMHRAMIELLREQFPPHAALFAGWPTPPTDPNDPNDPLPNGDATPFDPDMARAVQRIEKNPTSFATDDEFGLYVETSARPVPGNPFAQSPDPSAGIHNYLHGRFQDESSPVDMGNPQVNLDNARFWRLHGWIDAQWSAFRRAAGLSDADPAFRAAIDAQKHHLAGHRMPMGMADRGRLVGPIPVSILHPFRDSIGRRFLELTATSPRPQTVEELREYLKLAIHLEHFTIPLYLTAMWSLKPGTANTEHTDILYSVVLEEMLHLGLAANLLLAVGGTPDINNPDRVPRYPDYPPGIKDAPLLSLEAISIDQVKKFLRIELPEHGPIPADLAAVPTFPTIGDFYDAIDAALNDLAITFDPMAPGQLTTTINGEELFVIRSKDDARRAVRLIKQQGEGTDTSQGAPEAGGELAHYYRFEQIVRGMKYVQQPDGKYKLDPALPLPFPPPDQIYPMAPVPAGGYPGVAGADQFDQTYTTMVNKLQQAWTGTPSALGGAVGAMFGLGDPAVQLMKTPRQPPYPPGNDGPPFCYRPGSAPAGMALPTYATADAAPAVPGYARIKQILDDAVQGNQIGAHGPFWRTLTRDQFVAKSVFGKKLIATKPDGSFDPDESNLVKALEGRPPFGADLTPPPPGAIYERMPLGYPPVPPERIAEIRAWIGAGCPDAPPAAAAWVDDAAGGPADPTTHVAFWRDFDNRSMYQATPQTQDAIGVFFPAAESWMAFAKDPAQQPGWVAQLADPAVRDAVLWLEALQRDTVTDHYGRPVPLLTLLDALEKFGADQLPPDPQRPQDPQHRMNGRGMWFYWSAFCDACLRLAPTQAVIPAEFWIGLGRGILLGLLNDGLVRGRFAVTGFPAGPPGQPQTRDFARQLPAADLSAELAKRYRESGL